MGMARWMIPLRVQFYGTDGLLSKQLVLSDLRRDEDGECIPHSITMSNEPGRSQSLRYSGSGTRLMAFFH